MLMAGYPKLVVRDNAIYKEQKLKCYDGSSVMVAEIMITKEAFIEAHNTWVKNESTISESPVNEDCNGCMYENMAPDKHPCIDCKNNHKNYWRPKNV